MNDFLPAIMIVIVAALLIGFRLYHKKVLAEVSQREWEAGFNRGRDMGYCDKFLEDARAKKAREKARHGRDGKFCTPKEHL